MADAGVQKIYVGNLPFDVTREVVVDLYSKYGKVLDCYLPVNAETGTPRGFAFIKLNEGVADKAIEETNGMDFMGRPLVVSLPLPPSEKGVRKGGRDCESNVFLSDLSLSNE